MTEQPGRPTLPLSLKIAYAIFVAVLVPISVYQYGILNLLWFSNIALLGGLVAVWLENARIASVMAVATLAPELGWILGFVSGLLRSGEPLLGITAYMFDAEIPLWIRALALYHLALPVMLLWLIRQLGFDRRALRLWLPWGCAVLLLSWLLTDPERNVNLAFGPFDASVGVGLRLAWLAALLAASLVTWWATHAALTWLFGRLHQLDTHRSSPKTHTPL